MTKLNNAVCVEQPIVVSSTGILERLINWPTQALLQLMRWQELYVQRRALLGMSDHMLKDLGLNRGDVMHEARRPFWDDPLRVKRDDV